jgi:CheY-like chemotaxis protein
MSHGSIFRFQTQASAITGVTASDFHHAAIDADASARLAAMDRAFTEDQEGHLEAVEDAQREFDQIKPEQAADQVADQIADQINQPSVVDQEAPEQAAASSPAPESSAPEAVLDSLQDAHIEEEMLAALTAQAEAARATARPCSSEICADHEIDLNDPLAILSQAIAPQPVNDLSAAPEVDLVQVESNDAPAEIPAEELPEALPEAVSVELVEASPEVATEQTPEEVVNAETSQAATASIEKNENTLEGITEAVGISAAVEAASEMLVPHSPATESSADDFSPIETALAESESALDADADSAAPAPLEVTPILDASGELQPGADDYTPPAPFEIRVPEALVVAATPALEVADESATPATTPNVSAGELSESFDLDSLCAPTAAEQLTAATLDATIEQAIAQEEAVAEIKAAAEEFVTAQIAHDACVEAQLTTQSSTPCPPVAAAVTETVAASPLESAAAALKAEPASDRRKKRRALISSPIRVRSIDVTTGGPDEIATTIDVSRYGILFETVLDTYQRGMDVAVVFPYHKNATGQQGEQFGRVVRLHELPNNRHAVAIALGVGIGEHLVDSSGRQLAKEPVQISNSPAPVAKKLLVLVADSDAMLRDTTKLYLQNEGYEVIAVSAASDAREVLNMFMPAMIVAEIEGDGDVLPGLDLCAHVKSSPSLKHVPVVLTSRSAYPSDYSNAHSMGAVVCMAKPYKLERLGHIVRLLAPLPEHLQAPSTQRVPDPTRGFRSEASVALRQSITNDKQRNAANGNTKKSASNGSANLKSKFKFPTFR